MKQLLIIVALQLLIYIGWAVDYKAYQENGKYGYKNDAREWAIPPQYDSASDFNDEVGMVYIAGKYGLIDDQGEYIVPCEWDLLSSSYYKDYGVLDEKQDGLHHTSNKI